MTPDALLAMLSTSPPDAPLVFRTDKGEIRGGYHITELKLADIRSIDCGARRSSWRELSLQLLDGDGGDHMSVDRFRRILRQSAEHVDGLGATPMHVEFANDNIGMRLYQLAEPRRSGERVMLDLVETRARCKPAYEAATRHEGREAPCCGPSARSDEEPSGVRDGATRRCCASC